MKTKRMIAITMIVATGLSFGCSKGERKAEPAKPVKVVTVNKHSTKTTQRYSATIRPAAQVDVAFKVGGYIDSIAQRRDAAGNWRHLQAGDIVTQGTVLARVRQSDYVAKVNEVRSQQQEAVTSLETNGAQLKETAASVETSRAQLNDAKAYYDRTALDYERAKILFSTQSITKPEYDATKSTYEVAQAKLDAAAAQLKVAEARVGTARAQIEIAKSRVKTVEASAVSATIPLHDTELRAPMSAVVIERKVEVGTLVSQGGPAFVLADLSSAKAAFGVPDLALQHLKLGQTLSVTADGVPGTQFTGQISRISPAADQTSRVFDVEVSIANAAGLLKPGMIASLSVDAASGEAIELPVVPLTAITRSKDKPDAYGVMVVESRDGKQFAHLRTVSVGESMGNAVVVTNGVNAGEVVITTGSLQVADGEQVRVIP